MLAWARLSAPALRRRRGPAGKEMPCRAPPSPASPQRRRGLAGLPDEAPLRPPGVRFLGGLQAARLKLCLHSLLLGVQGDEITALVVDDPLEIVPEVPRSFWYFFTLPRWKSSTITLWCNSFKSSSLGLDAQPPHHDSGQGLVEEIEFLPGLVVVFDNAFEHGLSCRVGHPCGAVPF